VARESFEFFTYTPAEWQASKLISRGHCNYTVHFHCCRILSVFSLTDTGGNDNISIYPIGHDFVAASESHVNKFDAETLETKDGVSE